MLKKIVKKTVLAALAIVFVTGCSSRVEDYDNKNINLVAEELTFDESINFYMDTNESLKEYISDANFKNIVYAAYSTANELSTNNSLNFAIHSVKDKVEELDGDFFVRKIINEKSYSGKSNSIVKDVLENTKENEFSVIVTDFTTQLGDYTSMVSAITGVLAKNQAVAIIGVDTDVRPFFIVVVGSNKKTSEFISNFKQNPNVEAYENSEGGQTDGGLQLDIVRNINYQIFANDNGIMGINYKGIKPIENGTYYLYEYKEEKTPDGTVKQIPSFTVTDETEGSFSEINNDYYSKDLYKYIEGTVNFADVGGASVTNRYVQVMPPKSDDGEKPKEEAKTITVNDISYIAMRSLVSDGEKTLAGKFKLDVPFNIIDEVKLSSLDCELETKMYIPKDGQLVEYGGNAEDFIKVQIAEGDENQGKWRVDDENNSMLFNFMMDNAAEFPKSEGNFFKLDINIKQFMSKENMPKWVKEWSRTNKISNLDTLFNSIYGYQINKNVTQNAFSVYVGKASDTE